METFHFISNGEDPIPRKEGTNLSQKKKGWTFDFDQVTGVLSNLMEDL